MYYRVAIRDPVYPLCVSHEKDSIVSSCNNISTHLFARFVWHHNDSLSWTLCESRESILSALSLESESANRTSTVRPSLAVGRNRNRNSIWIAITDVLPRTILAVDRDCNLSCENLILFRHMYKWGWIFEKVVIGYIGVSIKKPTSIYYRTWLNWFVEPSFICHFSWGL